MLKIISYLSIFSGLVLFLFTGCSGYHVNNRSNPFAKYGIKKLFVPLFVNETLLTGLNSVVTSSVIKKLSSLSGLELVTSRTQADAILIGVLSTSTHYRDLLQTTQKVFLGENYAESLNGRLGQYVPKSQSYQIVVRLILVKNSSALLKKLLQSSYRDLANGSKDIIFNEQLVLNQSVTKNLWPRESLDDGGIVNFTQNEGILRRSYPYIGKNIGDKFQELILYAF